MANDTNYYDDFSAHDSELTDQLLAAALISKGNRTLRRIKKDVYTILTERVYQEIMIKVNDLTERTASYPHSRPVISMLLKKLMRFTKRKANSNSSDYFKTIAYQLDLAQKLERIDWKDHEINTFPPVDEVLIYMNYNSKTYIKMLQEWLAKRIEAVANPIERMEKKDFYKKAFLQLQRKPDIILYSDYTGLTEVIDNWFQHETEFLESSHDLYIKAKENQPEVSPDDKERVKFMMPSDQLAILIRAGYDSGLISAKSMNALFKCIIDYCSSVQRDELSPSSVRSSAYNPEQVDIESLVEKLKLLEKWIRGY